MPAPASSSKSDRRDALIAAAHRILRDKGGDGLTVRAVAKEAGTTTMAVYTLFGDKDGLARALHDDALAGMAEAFRSLPRRRNPIVALLELGTAYRQYSLDNPAWLALTTGRAHNVAVSAGEDARTSEAFGLLIAAVTRAQEAELLPGADRLEPSAVADGLWTVAHGHVVLEVAGYYADASIAADRFNAALRAIINGFAAPLPPPCPTR